MSDVLFVQFFSRSKNGYYDLSNGFSDTYDLCLSKGDFYWVEHEADSKKWDLESTYTRRPLPITKGTVYVSASYINHLYQAHVWARQNPDLQVVVGGPVAASRKCSGEAWDPLYFQIREGAEFPENLHVTGQNVEDLFQVPQFSGAWKVAIPREVQGGDQAIYLSYTLDNGCYWSKCIYCNIKEAPQEMFRRRKSLGFEFEAVDHPGRKIVRLNTGSVTPKNIREVLPNLPLREDLEYRTFMRSAKAENQALQSVLEKAGADFPQLTLGIGIEFPSDRMLQYMGKGITREDILETLRICSRYKVKVNGNVILGWGNLLESDLRDLEAFFEAMPEQSMASAQLRWLFAHPNTVIHEQYQGVPSYFGPFYLGFSTEPAQEQMELNKQAVRMIEKYSRTKQFKLEGLGNMKT